MSARIPLLLTLTAFAAAAQIKVAEIKTSGLEHLPEAEVIAITAVKSGATLSRDDLNDAAKRLFETGLFRSVNYRYDPNTGGFRVTFVLTEEAATTPVILDIAGAKGDVIWRDVKATDPLIGDRIPDNERAAAYYRHAIEVTLAKAGMHDPIELKNEVDLHTGKMSAIFRSSAAPKIRQIQFSGNQIIPAADLLAAISKMTIGEQYSERDFRRILEMNLTPLYEARAYLTVRFPAVEITNEQGAANVLVTVEEGPAWTLGTVNLTGDGVVPGDLLKAAKFKLGKLANWKDIQSSIETIENTFLADGYLGVTANPSRAFHEGADHIVDLTVSIRRGKQFLFGSIDVRGLSEDAHKQALALWSLKAGAPMNKMYVGDYLRAVFKALNGTVKSVSQDLRPRADSAFVDLTITFK